MEMFITTLDWVLSGLVMMVFAAAVLAFGVAFWVLFIPSNRPPSALDKLSHEGEKQWENIARLTHINNHEHDLKLTAREKELGFKS